MNETIEAESVLLAVLICSAGLFTHAQPQAGLQPRLPSLRVAVAGGLELSARVELTAENRLTAVLNDAKAVYPMRVDPTCSSAYWMGLDAIPSANYAGLTAVGDGAGDHLLGASLSSRDGD